MAGGITESQFFMWRTLFALAHVDHVVTSEEIRFMVEALEDVPFSEEQQAVLKEDIAEAQDPVAMYTKISDAKDQAAFFKFARDMVWADGRFSLEEREIMLKLQEIHVRNVNVDDLVGGVSLEIDEDYDLSDRNVAKTVLHFKEHFLRERFPT